MKKLAGCVWAFLCFLALTNIFAFADSLSDS